MPTRRAVLTAFAAGALAACTADENDADAPPQPDEAVLADAVAEVQSVLMLVRAVTKGRPARRSVLTGTRAVHESHLRVLQAGVAPTPSATGETRDRRSDRAAYLALAAAEDQLARRLRALSLRAESGSFARALAGMSASAAQQSAWLRSIA